MRRWLADMLPPSVIDLLDVKVEEVVIFVDRMAGRGADLNQSVRGLSCPTPHKEFVVTFTGKAMENASRVAAQVLPLRRPVPYGHEYAVPRQDRSHRVDAWAEVCAHRRQVHQGVLLPERQAGTSHIRRGARELSPRRHTINVGVSRDTRASGSGVPQTADQDPHRTTRANAQLGPQRVAIPAGRLPCTAL